MEKVRVRSDIFWVLLIPVHPWDFEDTIIAVSKSQMSGVDAVCCQLTEGVPVCYYV